MIVYTFLFIIARFINSSAVATTIHYTIDYLHFLYKQFFVRRVVYISLCLYLLFLKSSLSNWLFTKLFLLELFSVLPYSTAVGTIIVYIIDYLHLVFKQLFIWWVVYIYYCLYLLSVKISLCNGLLSRKQEM